MPVLGVAKNEGFLIHLSYSVGHKRLTVMLIVP